MASSSKVMFKLDVLKAKALEVIDARIAAKQLQADSYFDPAALQERTAKWRAAQEAKISGVFSKLGGDELDDWTLSKFKIDKRPESDEYEREKAERDVKWLENERARILAKSDALVGDADGNISLTKTQLQEFFGL